MWSFRISYTFVMRLRCIGANGSADWLPEPYFGVIQKMHFVLLDFFPYLSRRKHGARTGILLAVFLLSRRKFRHAGF